MSDTAPQQPVSGFDVPRAEHRSRLPKGLIIGLLVIGWAALLWATSLSLLAAIQIGMIGLGAIGTAIVAALWRRAT
jgi:hypothetical protein